LSRVDPDLVNRQHLVLVSGIVQVENCLSVSPDGLGQLVQALLAGGRFLDSFLGSGQSFCLLVWPVAFRAAVATRIAFGFRHEKPPFRGYQLPTATMMAKSSSTRMCSTVPSQSSG